MATSTSAPIGTHGNPYAQGRPEAPIVLTTDPPRPLRFFDQFAMWANLGISLFGPLTGALIAATTGSVWLGDRRHRGRLHHRAGLLGTSALFGATTGAPAMVSLRGVLGRRGSVAPTVLNIGQNIGWATMEIIVIATAASAILGDAVAVAVRPAGRRRGHPDGGQAARQRPAAAQGDGLAGADRLGGAVRPGAVPAAPGDPPGGRARLLAGGRPRRGGGRLVRSVGRRLQPSLADPEGRLLGVLAGLRSGGDRLLHPRCPGGRAPRGHRRDRGPGGVARRCHRPGHPAHRRGGRGLRQHLLHDHVGAEHRAATSTAGSWRWRSG